MDIFSKRKRSRIMAANKPKDTKPEKAVRSLLYSMGYRFRKNVKELPGTPDIVVLGYGTIVFVHGCFWHSHGCAKSSKPKTNVAFWRKKMSDNVKRDARNAAELEAMGWKVIVVWECQLSDIRSVKCMFKKELKHRKRIDPCPESRSKTGAIRRKACRPARATTTTRTHKSRTPRRTIHP